MTDHVVARDRDEDLTVVEVRVELGRGVLGQLEQSAQLVARTLVGFDPEVAHG